MQGDEAAYAADGVLDAAFLPGRMRIAEEGRDREIVPRQVTGELGAVAHWEDSSAVCCEMDAAFPCEWGACCPLPSRPCPSGESSVRVVASLLARAGFGFKAVSGSSAGPTTRVPIRSRWDREVELRRTRR